MAIDDGLDWFRHPEEFSHAEYHKRLIAEVRRLRSGGCARDQGLTQYCAEAAKFARRVAELESPWRPIDDDARNGAQWLIVLSDRRRMVGQYAGHQWRANGCHYDGDQVVAYAPIPPAPTED